MLTESRPTGRPRDVPGAVRVDGKVHIRHIDGRSRSARRFAALVAAFTREIGAQEPNEADLAIIRSAAGLTLKLEGMQADLAAGDPCDAEQLTRLSNVLSRVIEQLGARSRPKAKPSLQDYLRHSEDYLRHSEAAQ